jgi:acyl carrier protein
VQPACLTDSYNQAPSGETHSAWPVGHWLVASTVRVTATSVAFAPNLKSHPVDTQTEVLSMLDDVLVLGGRAQAFGPETALLGALPELDSMAVVTLINTMEERFGISVSDDEISGETFASVDSLTRFVAGKLA